ncbi:hypothetical protein SLEP1_g25626 [Rubroshorea leprosula]|uniref:Uncharacterized protein n=1 Tax=Rubroshorea leprosula TaxID=152421 RepID=A0AAV5JRR2_9ROSI|nr:hypothetical protein SLEP1_g25626 [Rubroshorea leprosula]
MCWFTDWHIFCLLLHLGRVFGFDSLPCFISAPRKQGLTE